MRISKGSGTLLKGTVTPLISVEFWCFLFPKLHYFYQAEVSEMISQINLDPDLFANKGKLLTARCWRPLTGDHTMGKKTFKTKFLNRFSRRNVRIA